MTKAERNRLAREPLSLAHRPTPKPSTPGTNPALRAPGAIASTGPGGRKGKTRYAGAGERGYRDAWSASPYYKTAATIDSRWSA